MIWLLLGCDAEPEDTEPAAAAVFIPTQGMWDIMFDADYGGDCALEDPTTGRGTELWYVDPSVNGHLTLRPRLYEVGACLVSDQDFTCVIGWLGTAVGASATETNAYSLVGSFADATTMSGALVIDASCEGGGCRSLADTYGPDFRYPCTATAGFTGVLAD